MEHKKGQEIARSEKFEICMQMKERMTKLEKKLNLLGKERCGIPRERALNKSRHASGPSDRFQHQRGRGRGENLGASERKAKQNKNSFRLHRALARDEEKWEESLSVDNSSGEDSNSCPLDTARTFSLEERALTTRVINQTSPPGTASGDDGKKRGLKFTQVDTQLPQGFGDQGLPHTVPVLGFRSSRSSARTASISARSHSAIAYARSTSTGISTRSPSATTSARSLSARTYNGFPSSQNSSISSRIAPSASSRFNLPEPVFPSAMNIKTAVKKPSSAIAQTLGHWEAVRKESEVWVLTDPPEPPPGIIWKKVTPPPLPSPPPCQQESLIKLDVHTVDEHGEEGEQLDLSSSSISMVPELVPSVYPPIPTPKSVIRQVVVMPSCTGYPGFCDSSEALRAFKSKRSFSSENMGEKKRLLGNQESEKQKIKSKLTKVQPVRVVANVHEGNRKHGFITPSAWRTGLKYVKKELGPWKGSTLSGDVNKHKENHQGNVLQKNLKDLHKYVEDSENKISDFKSQKKYEIKKDYGTPEIHIFNRETSESANYNEEKSGEKEDISKFDDVIVLSESMDKNVLNHALLKEDNSGKKYAQVEHEGDTVKSPVKNCNEFKISKKTRNERHFVTKSSCNLNNAFIVDDEKVLPKRSNSFSNFQKKSCEVSISKSAQNSRHYDPKKIKEYIRTQKQLRYKKLFEEKERKRMQEEKKRTKLLELRSKSKELVEVSLKKKNENAKQEIEFLQTVGLELNEMSQKNTLKEKNEVQEAKIQSTKDEVVSNLPAEKKISSHSYSSKSKSPSDTHDSFHANALIKSLNHVAMQTEDELEKSVSENLRNKIIGDSDNLSSSLRFPSITCETISPISNAKLIVQESNFNEKSGSSEKESCRVILDPKMCGSIQREIKKLSQNVYVLEKHKMIGIFPERFILPPSLNQREVPLKNSFETPERLQSDLNNKNASLMEAESQMCSKTLDFTPVYCSNSIVPNGAQNPVYPQCLSYIAHCSQERASKTKSSVNNLDLVNDSSIESHDTSDASIKIQTFYQEYKAKSDRNTTQKNNALPLQFREMSQNHETTPDSFISEGLLNEETMANVDMQKEPQLNNLCGNVSLKNSEEKKKGEVPFWLRKPPMESHPFNFISAVKMKLNQFLEEQNKKNVPEALSNIVQPQKLVLVQTSNENILLPNGKENITENLGANPVEQDVQYDSDFESTILSGTCEDVKANPADSSDLDTATEEILPTDEVPKSEVPLPKHDVSKVFIDSTSDSISEISKKCGSSTSILSRYSNSDYQLMAPDFTLSKCCHDHISKTAKNSSISQCDIIQNSHKYKGSDEKDIFSIQNAIVSNKSEQSTSYESCKTEILLASGLKTAESSTSQTVSKNYLRRSSVISLRRIPQEDLSSQFQEVISSNSAEGAMSFISDESHNSSRNQLDGLYLPIKADLRLQSASKNISHENKTSHPHPPVLPIQRKVSSQSAKGMIENHTQKLAEMEQKAFVHRLEMERALERERHKLELALAEAKKTVLDSQLEASKFISDAAVELVRSQAEATKANAEATKHLSEAKAMDSLKLETVSAKSATAAAFAAVQAAMKQLQGFKRVKHNTKNHTIEENCFSSIKSEGSISSFDETHRNISAEKESEESSTMLEQVSAGTHKTENIRNASISEVVNVVENVATSVQNVENTVAKHFENFPKDSSLHSISENISEPDYSSNFDDTASERVLKIVPGRVQGDTNTVKIQDPETKGTAENKKVISHFRKKNGFKTDLHKLASTIDTHESLESFQVNEESFNTDQDSFTKFSLSMFRQLMREEEMRAQHQRALLKLREDALIDKTKAEMTLLELKKKQYRDKGQEDIISSIRKKQRGLLIRLKLEKDEIQRLKKFHKTASHERRMMLTQQQHIVKMRMSTKEIMNKLQTKKLPATPKAIRAIGFIGSVLDTSKSSVEINTEESALGTRSNSNVVAEELQSMDATHSDASLPKEPPHSSRLSVSDSESHSDIKQDTIRLEKQVIHGLNDLERNKKFLSEREKNLIHRRQAVEELLLWRKRLEQEEERVRALESQALAPHSHSRKAQTSFRSNQDFSIFKADRSTSPLHLDSALKTVVDIKLREDAATSVADLSLAHSESVLEDVPIDSQKSSISVAYEFDSKKLEQLASETPSSTSVIKTDVNAEQQYKDSASLNEILETENNSKSEKSSVLSVSAKEESQRSSLRITIKSPLTPYIQGRQKRRHSSGSDESIILSQNETASEQSDIESKICALQEQLRRRKMEAELLKREQKRCQRERLKAKEQSLIKQIQAYDLYIQRARMELEQECESPTASVVKPQIKQPRLGEWKKKVDEPKELLSETAEKTCAFESLSEVVELTPALESQTEKSEKMLTSESLSVVAEKTPALEESGNIPPLTSAETPNASQIQNHSSASLSEVLEEIPSPTEELPVLENSPCSLSRGSSVETTIESPTKQDTITESLTGAEIERLKKLDIAKEAAPEHASDASLRKQNVVSKVVNDAKSDDYDEDTFKQTAGAIVELEGTSLNKQNEKLDPPEYLISEEMVQELSYSGTFEQRDPLASEVSNFVNLSVKKVTDIEKEVIANYYPEEESTISSFQQPSEELVSLPSYLFVEQTVPQLNLEETFIVSIKPAELSIENEMRAVKITEYIFQNLFEEFVFEAEILINKNSTCALVLSESNEKMKELFPLHEEENYEEIRGQKSEDLESRNFISDTLLQILLEDATFEMVEILEKRESFFKHKKSIIINPDDEGYQNVTSAKKNSDVMKRVQQIMLESSLSQISPREKSRPQDLMITTYDVLSPDSSNCNSPILE